MVDGVQGLEPVACYGLEVCVMFPYFLLHSVCLSVPVCFCLYLTLALTLSLSLIHTYTYSQPLGGGQGLKTESM